MKNFVKITFFAFACLCIALSTVYAGNVYDAKKDFSVTNGNPNGVWSYGWMDHNFKKLNLFDKNNETGTPPHWFVHTLIWYKNSSALSISKNVTTGPLWGIAPGQLALHPGPNHVSSVLRFTSPNDDKFSIIGQFSPGESCGVMKVGIRQGEEWIWNGIDKGEFDIVQSLQQNETLDFVVYGGYTCGTTGIDVIIRSEESVSPVSGCVNMKGIAITKGTASLIQSGEFHQKVTIDNNGCYSFDRIVEDRPFSIIIRRNVE